MGIIFAKRLRRQHARDIPRTPTNEDRLREYRQRSNPQLGNSRKWAWHRY